MASLEGARVAIVVVGDLGRSPRMLYHALACADAGALVDVIATVETPVPACIAGHRAIVVHPLRRRAPIDARRGAILRAGTAVMAQTMALLSILLARTRRPEILLVQTPPAIPTLPAAIAASRLRGARLVVDWHNVGWSVAALKRPAGGAFVRTLRTLERGAAGGADAHLCVSDAMRAALPLRPRDRAVVFHDRPAARFTPALRAEAPPESMRAVLAESFGGVRPFVALAPGSWMLDEDVDLLLQAVELYDQCGAAVPLLLLLSGDGPRKPSYEQAIERRGRRARVRTIWVPYEEYPRLVAHADVGVSIHRSASGADLPMKVADFRGGGVPVLALRFDCLADAYRGDLGVRWFSTARELADGLARCAADGSRAAERRGPTWEEEWRRVCLPLLAGLARSRQV